MAAAKLSDRVAKLEAEVSLLREKINAANTPSMPKWRQAVEKFSGDEGLLSIFEEARKLREADRKATRPKQPSRRAKS